MAEIINNWLIVDGPGPMTDPENARGNMLASVDEFRYEGDDSNTKNLQIKDGLITGRFGNLVVTSEGARHELGTPYSEYAEAYPRARSRLLRAL